MTSNKPQQIIKHRKGCVDKVKDIQSYLGEIIYGTGNIGDITGNVAFIGNSEGRIGGYSPISKIYFGVNAPTVNPYGTTLNGLPFYSVYDKTLYILQNPKNIDMDLSGNIYRRNIAPNNISASGFISGNGLNITGDVKLGRDSTNVIEINGRIKGDLIPIVSNTYSLGSPSLKWKNIYADYITGSFEGDGTKLKNVPTSMSIQLEGSTSNNLLIILPNEPLQFYTDTNKGLDWLLNGDKIEITTFDASYSQKGVSYYTENQFIVTDGLVEIDYTFFNDYTSSVDDILDDLYQYTSSMNAYTSSMNVWSASINGFTSSINLWTESINANIVGLYTFTSSMKSYTSSMNAYTSSMYIWTSSVNTSLNNLNLFTASVGIYTSSMNIWTGSITSSLNSLNLFTASINSYTSSMNIWTGSIIDNFNSLYQYTSSMNIWTGSIESFTASIGIYTSSMNIWTGSISSSLNNLNLFTASIKNYTSSMNIWTESVNSSLNGLNLFTASVNSYTSSMNIWTGSINLTTGSLEVFSASLKSYTSSMNIWTGSISASLNGLNLFTASIKTYTTSLNLFTSSINTYTSSINLFTSSINIYTSSMNVWSASINLTTGSLESFTSSLKLYTSSINAFSKTFNGAANQILLSTASVFSNTINFTVLNNSTVNYKLDDNLRISQSITTNQLFATTSSVTGNATFGGNVQITGNLTVNGTVSSSNSSTIDVGTNILNLTASVPANGGIYVNNSPTQTGSILWDSVNLYWKAGLVGSEKRIVLQELTSSLTNNALVYANSAGRLISAAAPTTNSIPMWNGTSWINITSASFATSASFNILTGSFNTFTGSINSYTSSMNLATASFFRQNGNSFGANAVLGTNDNFSLSFETNNLTRATITNDGKFLFNSTDSGTGRYQFDNGHIVLTNGRLGIGTKFPDFPIDIYDNYYDETVLAVQTSQDAYILQVISNYYSATLIGTLANTNVPFLTGYLPYSSIFGSVASSSPLQLFTNAVARFTIFDDGNVSIGTSNNAGRTLYINGDVAYATKLYTFSGGGTNGQFLKATAGNDTWANILTTDVSGLNAFTSSINGYTSSMNIWTGSINGSTTGLNLFTASLKSYTSSMNIWTGSINLTTGSLEAFSASIKTYTSSMNIWTGSISSSLNGLNLFSSSIKTYTSSVNTWIGGINIYTSSMNIWTGSISSSLNGLNQTTGALEIFSASIKTYTSSMNIWTGSISSSLNGLNLFTSSINGYTSSMNIWTASINLTTGSLEAFTSSLKLYTSSMNIWTGSINQTTGALEIFTSSLKSYTSSMNIWTGSINSFTSSLNLSTGSFFRQNGNSFGVNALLGTNDEYSLSFETNGINRMHINTSGSVGIATTDLIGVSFRVAKPITGAGASIAIRSNGIVQSDAIAAYYFRSDSNIVNGASPTTLYHYAAIQGVFGTATLVNQFGYTVNDLTGSTNTYGYHSGITTGSGKWGLYMGGNANNFLAGRLGIGSTSLIERTLYLALPFSGSSISHGFYNASTIASDFTTVYYNRTQLVSLEGNTVANVIGYNIFESNHNATISGQYGILINDMSKGSVINVAYRSVLSAAANKWNLYIDGTANNYLNGNLGLGITAPTDRLSVVGAINYTTTLKVNGSTGTNGQFLKTTGTTNTWSSLGTFDINGLNDFTASINLTTGSLESFSASIKTYTSSVNTWIGGINGYTSSMNVWTGSINSTIGNLNVFSASIKTYTSSMNVYTSSINTWSGSINSYTSSMNVWTGSISSSLNNLNLFSASLKSYTSSMNLWTSSLNASTASFFRQNGNSFGLNAVLGTNDNFSLFFETNGVNRAFISSSGKFIVGTVSTPNGLFNVGGDVYVTGQISAENTSDYRLKNNVKKIDNSLYLLSQINGYSFNWNDNQKFYDVGTKDIGVIAQEIEKIFPEIVKKRNDGYLSVKYDRLIAVLIEGVNELKKEIDILKKK